MRRVIKILFSYLQREEFNDAYNLKVSQILVGMLV